MPQSPQASIIILTLDHSDLLDRCLAALQAQTLFSFEVIIVDNGSSQDWWTELGQKYVGLVTRIERMGINAGFAAANNHAARLARGEWLVFLNNDAFPEPNWLRALMHAAAAYPKFQFFSSRLIQANNPAYLDGTGDVFHTSGLSWRRCYNQPANEYGLITEEVFSACGAAAMFSRNWFMQAGGFDEDLFTYNEDTDLGFRLRLRGARCLYVPQAVVNHVGSATTGRKSDFAIYHGQRNLVWVFFQNMPARLIWKYLPAHLLANCIMLIYYSFTGNLSAIWRAKIDAVRGLGRALHKRSEIQKTRCISVEELERVMDRRWLSPYQRGKH